MKKTVIIFFALICLALNAFCSHQHEEIKGEAAGYVNAANAFLAAGNYAAAKENLDKAVNILPWSAGLYCMRAYIKAALGDYAGALEDYDITIQLDKKDADAYANRAAIKYVFGDYKGAVKDSNKAIKYNPQIGAAYLTRGNAKFSLKKWKSALKDFDKALELNPVSADIYFSRGYAKEQLKENAAAAMDYFEAIEKDPDFDEAYENFEIVQRKLKRAGLTEEYDKAENYTFKSPDSYLKRAEIRYKMRDYKKALSDLEKLAELAPKDYRAYYYAAVIEYNIGNFQSAVEYFTKAITNYELRITNQRQTTTAININPKKADLYFYRAIAKNRTGDYASAQDDLDKVIAMQPRNGKAYLARALVKEAQKDLRSARVDLNKADSLGANLADVNINEIPFEIK
ncbi:MAG: tetratricopeptide repeat protein [Endomicrobia bacterium]|nr:tetratricopeptide repeat protein [Endomicrobiia bacterium]